MGEHEAASDEAQKRNQVAPSTADVQQSIQTTVPASEVWELLSRVRPIYQVTKGPPAGDH